MENTLLNLDNEIQSNKELWENKQAFYAISKVQKSLDKLDELLSNQNTCNTTILTRAVAEYNQVTFSASKCKNVLKNIHMKVILLLAMIYTILYIINN